MEQRVVDHSGQGIFTAGRLAGPSRRVFCNTTAFSGEWRAFLSEAARDAAEAADAFEFVLKRTAERLGVRPEDLAAVIPALRAIADLEVRKREAERALQQEERIRRVAARAGLDGEVKLWPWRGRARRGKPRVVVLRREQPAAGP